MSNALLARPMRPLSASIASNLRCCGGPTTTTTTATSTTAKPSTSASPASPIAHTQRRHESTTRRQLNRLRSVPSAPYATPSPSHTADHIIFNPPSSAPSVYHTPLKFLPAHDRRRELYALTSRFTTGGGGGGASAPGGGVHASTGTALSAGAYTSSSSILPPHLAHHNPAASSVTSPASGKSSSAYMPPALRTPYTKKYHLTAADIEQIRQLRAQDPAHWTRERLAAKFECSQFFVGLVAPAPERAAQKLAEIDEVKRGWGRTKREAREDRRRRKEAWGRDA
ncbi:60s ribosomal protein [Diplodia corticola]|uniref:60s ribosomal protein n=1 Tax=Diplodia corticola TaxID=236234 RepID=A0A1J9QS09_9PEZI|nr:60s ribosomal protein [Diplodia corticola]OJD31742.1 60s ribosomal protein [Diplodia corticola]